MLKIKKSIKKIKMKDPINNLKNSLQIYFLLKTDKILHFILEKLIKILIAA